MMKKVKIHQNETRKKKKQQKEKENIKHFSLQFQAITRWIVNTGGVSYEKAPLLLTLCQKLFTGTINMDLIPSEKTLRDWEETFAEADTQSLSEELQQGVINIASDLSMRRGEEVSKRI